MSVDVCVRCGLRVGDTQYGNICQCFIAPTKTMSDLKKVRFNPDYADKSMRIHDDGLWILFEDHDRIVAQKDAQIAKLREQRNEVIQKTSTWPTTDAIHDHYEIELEEYLSARSEGK